MRRASLVLFSIQLRIFLKTISMSLYNPFKQFLSILSVYYVYAHPTQLQLQLQPNQINQNKLQTNQINPKNHFDVIIQSIQTISYNTERILRIRSPYNPTQLLLQFFYTPLLCLHLSTQFLRRRHIQRIYRFFR